MAAAGPAALAMQASAQIIGGIEANRAAKGQARVDDENARLSILGGEQDALQTRRDERMQTGALIASMGADGVQLGSGSATDVLAENAYQRELEIYGIRTKATQQANNLYQSATDRRAAGKSALTSAMFGAAATALKGVSDMRAQRVQSEVQAGQRVPRPMIMGVSR